MRAGTEKRTFDDLRAMIEAFVAKLTEQSDSLEEICAARWYRRVSQDSHHGLELLLKA